MHVALNRVDFSVYLLHDLVTKPFGFPLAYFIAVTEAVPLLRTLHFVLSHQNLHSVSYIPIRPRPFLPKRAGHLVFPSRHSTTSFEWRGEDWLERHNTII